ncbi:MAG: hypothetical protein QOE45_2233 [Frankiaceae bacterium]|jgi:hypothetical protein|nr:hypothetical protein [Frankiaceae bacterium]
MNVVILQGPTHSVGSDPLAEVWETNEVCQIDGLYEDTESSHVVPFYVGDTFTSSATDFGVATRRRLILFL